MCTVEEMGKVGWEVMRTLLEFEQTVTIVYDEHEKTSSKIIK